jgi:predicted HAD superfamily Cof-like phosphohydrolase
MSNISAEIVEPVHSTDPVFDAIYDFNEMVVGVAVDLKINGLTDDQRKWMSKALREEAKEFDDAEAVMSHSFEDFVVAQVDALLDSIYFAVGGLKKMGLTRAQAYECMMAVHRANMNKKRGGKASRGNFAEDAVRTEEFVPPEAAIKRIIFGGI